MINSYSQVLSTGVKNLWDTLKTTLAKTAPNDEQAGQQPGALSLPPDPAALLDTRYLWSPQGWLLHTQRQGAALQIQNPGDTAHHTERQTQAYNRAGQLLASVRSTGTPEQASQETAVWRYAWQPRTQQRLLAQAREDGAAEIRTREQAVAEMEAFVAEATEALEALKAKREIQR